MGSRGGAVYLTGATAEIFDCTIEGCSAKPETDKNQQGGDGGAVCCHGGTLTLDKGCIIRKCRAVQAHGDSIVELYNCIIENCFAVKKKHVSHWSNAGSGGAVYVMDDSALTVNEGCSIKNCIATWYGGAVYYSESSKATAYLRRRVFQGNTCSQKNYAGSGSGMVSSGSADNCFEISGNVKFYGDGTDSGMDGVYLDTRNSLPQKITVGKTLGEPVTIYLRAVEHYVVAEGTDDYHLTEEDQEKISVVDVSGRKWYKKLDAEANQIYLTNKAPVSKNPLRRFLFHRF